jgi:uncharacterized membrane protein HdeD (DUF308 family)
MPATDNTGPQSLGDGIKALRARWGWIVALGVISVIAGALALGSVVMATASAVMIVGVMMLIAGCAEIAAAFGIKDWGHFLFWLLVGVLYALAGFVCLTNPFEGARILTLLLGISLAIIGLVRVYLASQMKHDTPSPWGWVAFSGVLSFLVGLMIIAGWPSSSFFVLGLLLGMDLIFIGTTWVAMGLALKDLP